ncbi:hypothetical protein PR048_030796 [Dryococelus australis]|uniref:Uncharacterized protein n=1 Tax=Dryococelus australis TaxID=614101 RepID=A0ABQ9G9X5_9NEOP|nr:hypothetical protein PR048_030796 [Dryococelus australis]
MNNGYPASRSNFPRQACAETRLIASDTDDGRLNRGLVWQVKRYFIAVSVGCRISAVCSAKPTVAGALVSLSDRCAIKRPQFGIMSYSNGTITKVYESLLRPVAPSWFENRSEVGSEIDTENCCTILVQSWTGDRDEVHLEPPKLACDWLLHVVGYFLLVWAPSDNLNFRSGLVNNVPPYCWMVRSFCRRVWLEFALHGIVSPLYGYRQSHEYFANLFGGEEDSNHSLFSPTVVIGRQFFRHAPFNCEPVTDRKQTEQQRIEEAGENGRSPRKTRRTETSSCTNPTCENPGVTLPGIEPGSPWLLRAANRLSSGKICAPNVTSSRLTRERLCSALFHFVLPHTYQRWTEPQCLVRRARGLGSHTLHAKAQVYWDGFDSRRRSSRIFARGNSAIDASGWRVFSGISRFPPPLHSDAVTHSTVTVPSTLEISDNTVTSWTQATSHQRPVPELILAHKHVLRLEQQNEQLEKRLNFTVLCVLEPTLFLHWLLHRYEATPFLTELHVIGAHDCEVVNYWCRVTQDVTDTSCSNDKRAAKLLLSNGLSEYSSRGLAAAIVEAKWHGTPEDPVSSNKTTNDDKSNKSTGGMRGPGKEVRQATAEECNRQDSRKQSEESEEKGKLGEGRLTAIGKRARKLGQRAVTSSHLEVHFWRSHGISVRKVVEYQYVKVTSRGCHCNITPYLCAGHDIALQPFVYFTYPDNTGMFHIK